MISRRFMLSMSGTALLALAFAAPGMAQSSSAPASVAPAASVPAGPAIMVIATDYHFGDLPTTVPVGTTLTLDNQGVELHELVIARKNDGVTQTFEELLAMGDEALAFVTPMAPLFAMPGATAEGSLVIAQEGEYIALCFVPQGMTELPDPSASPDPAMEMAPPHFALGMMQLFEVTAAGTEVGPLPPSAPMGSEMPAASTAP